MKILFCTSFFEHTHNGAGQFANTIFQINKLFPDHEVRILSEDISHSSDFHYPILIKYPPIVQAFGMILRSISYYRAAKKIQQSYDFDILFFNNAFTGIWSALWMGKKTKVVGFIHDDNFLSYKLSNFSFSKKWFIRYFYRQMENIAVKLLDIVFTNTHYLRKAILANYGAKPIKIQQSYVPVDIQAINFHPDRQLDPKQNIKILFVKNDYLRGGLEDLVLALGKLSYSFQLTVIGPFSSEAHKIHALVQKQSNIELNFQANRSQKEVFTAMQNHHILCIPARKEGQGVANIEGLAHGISVISTRIGGIPEVMDKGKNGWLVDVQQDHDLAMAIQDCIQNPGKRIQKARQGRVFVSIHFESYNILKQLLLNLESL